MFELIGNFLFLEKGHETGIAILTIFVACGVVSSSIFLVLLWPAEKFKYVAPLYSVAGAVALTLSVVIPSWTAPLDKLTESIVNEPNIALRKCILEGALSKIEGNKTARLSYENFSYIRMICKHEEKGTEAEQVEKFKKFSQDQLDKIKTLEGLQKDYEKILQKAKRED